jgi:hypothetical protein
VIRCGLGVVSLSIDDMSGACVKYLCELTVDQREECGSAL